MVTWADAADAAAASPARTAELSRPTAIDPSERLQIFAHVHLLSERAGLHREVDELLVVRFVLGREILGHEVPDHWNRIDDVVGVKVFLTRCLRASCGLELMSSTALPQAAVKRLATSGRLLMKSLVRAQPPTNALALGSPNT